MHEFIDFKGFSKAQIELFKSLTVLIGPNGSGKTNLTEGIELLSFIANGGSLHDVSDIGRGGKGLKIRGGLQSCASHLQARFSMGFGASFKFESNEHKNYWYDIGIETFPEPRIWFERLAFHDGTIIFKAIGQSEATSSGDIIVEFNNFAQGRNPKASVANGKSVLSQYEFFAKTNKKYNACMRLVSATMNHLRQSFVFDPNPKLMRTYERIGNNVLSKDGANLSSVLYHLSKGSDEDKQTLQQLLDWIKHLPGEPYKGFEFVTTSLNDVILGLKEGDNFIDARLLSDGTLRCLAVLTALETVASGSRVIIEEFDNGLHPSRVHILLQAMKSCCERRKLNILVTTHNPATLNALDEKQLEGVVFCAWDKESKSTKLISLKDLPRHDELLESGQLGDLVTRQVVDKYFSPEFEEEHKKNAMDWLRSLP